MLTAPWRAPQDAGYTPSGGTQSQLLMANWQPVDFQVPEAQLLADLTGVASDLDMVLNICQTYLHFQERRDITDLWQKQSLCMAAVTMYMRTANTGVRSGIGMEQLDQLSKVHRADHVHFKNLRDKWVAHSVNSFEETNVMVYPVPPERGPRAISQVTTQHRFTCTLSHGEVNRLIDLAQTLKGLVDVAIADEKRSLLTFAQSLPVDDFYERPEKYKQPSQNPDPSTARRRYRRT